MRWMSSAALVLVLLAAPHVGGAEISIGQFRFSYGDRGVSGLADPNDPFGAEVVAANRPIALAIRGKVGEGAWTNLIGSAADVKADPKAGAVTCTSGGANDPLRVSQTFKTDGAVLDWTIDLAATGDTPVTVGDLGISIPATGPRGENPTEIFERGFIKHQFISGSGSFFFSTRASGAPPFLLVTVLPGTHLEYFGGAGGRGEALVYVHSALVGGNETRGTWRQKHTSLTLTPGSTARYGFRFHWAMSYAQMREILYQEGLFDIRVVPGMTVPSDLTARFALRTKAKIESILPEFPDQTTLKDLGLSPSGYRIYEVAFKRLGENLLTIRHDGGRETYLEFFSTEPLETLIKKRSAFLVEKQQIRDPSKWWDGVFGPYNMKNHVTRTIDDPDIFTGRMVYVLTCDDPGLCKAPFIASKNVAFPNRKEIEAIEYYLEHFVWGKLQRTDEETPYPYGVYGTPEWHTDRDPNLRRAYTNRDLDKMHVWRSYDYPHVVMLYYHMYEIAKLYPEMSKYLDAAGYLERAFQTARAFYIYPYEIYPSYYETYKWGLYDELVVLKLIDALEREGFQGQADFLRREWEKKVKYFVYDDEYPLRSEYAFDRTAFESSQALAKYGATHDMQPDEHLWWDIKQKKWYSHPVVRRDDSRAFMDRQIAGNLVVRGWLETSYYQLGADAGLSYMAAMGGWSVLDYGLNFANDPFDWLELGYASYLSSWALMNTGTPQSNYGYWAKGKENDGAAGWQFMSSKYGRAWMGADVPRGAWHYDGEIDLGFGGALRMARTLVMDDPVFGWIACGGTMMDSNSVLSTIPRDGLRKRFDVIRRDPRAPWLRPERLGLELNRDGFSDGQPILADRSLAKVSFALENRTGDAHSTELSLHLPYGASYEMTQDGRPVELVTTSNWEFPWRAIVRMTAQPAKIELTKIPRK